MKSIENRILECSRSDTVEGRGGLPLNFQMPQKIKVLSYLRTLKMEEDGKSLDTLTPMSLQTFVLANDKSSLPLQNNQDIVFVCGYEVDESYTQFRMCLSTLRLLSFVPDSCDKIHADDTHNLIWGQCPLMVIGFTDKWCQFHPVMFALCLSKKATDYQYIFETYRKFRPNQMIRYGLCDGAEASFDGLAAAYEHQLSSDGAIIKPIRLMCWMHFFGMVIGKNFKQLHILI